MTSIKVTLTLPVREGVASEEAKHAAIEAGNLLMERVGDFPATMMGEPLTWHVEQVKGRAWVVVNNVTGLTVSKDYDNEDYAALVCRGLNRAAGPGGLFGVQEVTR